MYIPISSSRMMTTMGFHFDPDVTFIREVFSYSMMTKKMRFVSITSLSLVARVMSWLRCVLVSTPSAISVVTKSLPAEQYHRGKLELQIGYRHLIT